MPPSGERTSCTSSMKLRMKKIPRPLDLRMFSGASGSGKSSLVKAALVPRVMKPQRLPNTAFLRRVVFRPGDGASDLVGAFADRAQVG